MDSYVKNEIIGNKRNFVEKQKLDEAKRIVIKENECDDILILEPPTIIDAEWKNNTLTIYLSKDVNQKWVWSMQSMGSFTSVMGKGPEKFNVRGNLASVSANEQNVQRILDYFKQWLPKINSTYKRIIEQENREKYENEKREAERLVKEREKVIKINNSLKI